MRYVTATFHQPDWYLHPMQAFIRREDAVEYEELLAWNLLPERDVEHELFYVVADLAPYREAVESVDGVRWYNVSRVDEDSFYVYACQETREEDRRFRAAFADLGLVVVPPVVYDANADLHLTLVGEADDFRSVLASVPEGFSVTVDEVGEYDRRHGRLAGALTDRQFEAVAAAVELGYYETPREATLADVADAIDCAPSTASNHLQKAEAAVMGRLVEW